MKKKLSFSEINNNDVILYFGIAFLGSIAIPFVYYSIIVNMYGSANAPEGFNFPHICDFWRVLVGAFFTQFTKSISVFLFTAIFKSVAKGESDKHKFRY